MSARSPLRFVFGLHLHQPVGNFDHVIAQHVRDVYRPFLERATAAGFFPLTVHVSGPLLEWLEAHDSAWVDALGRLAADAQVELLLAGFDEPILAALPPADRLEQIARMRAHLQQRFGVAATGGGLWLTERVWQPELAADLAAAGIEYVLVDDRHFLISGFRRDQLHRPFRSEAAGRSVGLLAIDERLRYLIPFRPPEETAAYIRDLRAAEHELAILADDGEKFGGWPGTHAWVYDAGWLDAFLRTMERLVSSGEMRLVTAGEAFRTVPSAGIAYLGTASYREMEKWSLPAAAQLDLTHLEEELGARRQAAVAPFVRGAHWHNFLVKYPEANRMHKTMLALSDLTRSRGDLADARRAVGRAQCNDAYWHGVFGGLYLPHLRHAIWHQLAIAEQLLRRGEALAWESRDLDYDGFPEIWVHSSAFSALVSPHRGGAVEMLVRFRELQNFADVLTRRREAYHENSRGHGKEKESEAARSIHDIERQAVLPGLPPVDNAPRALLVDRLLPISLTEAEYAAGRYTAAHSWAGTPMSPTVTTEPDAVVITLEATGLVKRLRFDADGCLRAAYEWETTAGLRDCVFAPELSLAHDLDLKLDPDTDVWRYPIITMARSERGFEETVQGQALTPRWPAKIGSAALELGGPSP